MYTEEEKRRAVELFVQYDCSCMAVINELGYPCRDTLYKWHREYAETGCVVRRSLGRLLLCSQRYDNLGYWKP